MRLHITLDEPTMTAMRELVTKLIAAGVPADRTAEAVHAEALVGMLDRFQDVAGDGDVLADIANYLATHAPQRPEQPPLYLAYVITPYMQEHITSYDQGVITAWLKRQLAECLEDIKAEIGTGEEPERAPALLAPGATPDEVIDLMTEHYAINSYALNVGWTTTTPVARLATDSEQQPDRPHRTFSPRRRGIVLGRPESRP